MPNQLDSLQTKVEEAKSKIKQETREVKELLRGITLEEVLPLLVPERFGSTRNRGRYSTTLRGDVRAELAKRGRDRFCVEVYVAGLSSSVGRSTFESPEITELYQEVARRLR